MHLIFCSDPLEPKQPDSTFLMEVAAARRQGFMIGLVDYELLVSAADPSVAMRAVRGEVEPTPCIYRGWMLKPVHYKRLYDALLSKRLRLINDPASYQHCHYLPDCYADIATRTPKSVWLRVDGEVNYGELMELLKPFGASPVIVKVL